MSARKAATQKLTRDLQKRLNAAADAGVKEWFENYLRGAIKYRGVRTPKVAAITGEWRRAHNLAQRTLREQLNIAAALVREDFAEDKFAGAILMQKYLVGRGCDGDILSAAEKLFSGGAFYDWSTTDWFCVRVLAPVLKNGGMQTAKRLSGWKTSPNLWQRRASLVPFRAVAGDETYHALIGRAISTLVVERERFIQTAIGWLLSDISKTHPQTASRMFERHRAKMSSEILRRHTKYL